MTESTNSYDVLSSLIKESSSYRSLQDLERLIDQAQDLSVLPLQPLYLSLKSSDTNVLSELLPKLGSEYRSLLLDLDIWKKDEVDFHSYSSWLMAYAKCKDDSVRREFSKSSHFALLLKGQVNVYEFDVEEPMYPDHDYYFLTEDNLLLIEYSKEFKFVDELKALVKELYSELGVENAYAHLYKIVTDSYMNLSEQEYNAKIERLRDYGFLDYYESLHLRSGFASRKQLESFVNKKKGISGELDVLAKSQALHSTCVAPFTNGLDSIFDEINKVKDQKRLDFLSFNFVRLVNGNIAVGEGLKSGISEVNKISKQVKQRILLGFSYLKSELSSQEVSLFEKFDFFDIHRIGFSLLQFVKQDVKISLKEHKLDEPEVQSFLGIYWNHFLDNLYMEEVSFRYENEKRPFPILEMERLKFAQNSADSLVKMLPYIYSFLKEFSRLKNEGVLQDHFYLNYAVNDIDFEAIVLSSFAKFSLSQEKVENKKLAVSVEEFKDFIDRICILRDNEHCIDTNKVEPLLKTYMAQFSFDSIPGFDRWFMITLDHHLSGYNYQELETEEFKHVGGPILLSL